MTSHDPACRADPADRPTTWDIWTRRLGAFAVAAVAAYASYQHQLNFALTGGSDLTTARLWPLSVDGLLVLSTAGLLRGTRRAGRRSRWTLRGGVRRRDRGVPGREHCHRAVDDVGADSGCRLATGGVAARHRTSGSPSTPRSGPPRWRRRTRTGLSGRKRRRESVSRPEPKKVIDKVVALSASRLSRHTAEQVMWEHYQNRVTAGLPAPTGAELDQVAETNNYGRAVLRKWHRQSRTGPTSISAGR